jgi:hypothetical protein
VHDEKVACLDFESTKIGVSDHSVWQKGALAARP